MSKRLKGRDLIYPQEYMSVYVDESSLTTKFTSIGQRDFYVGKETYFLRQIMHCFSGTPYSTIMNKNVPEENADRLRLSDYVVIGRWEDKFQKEYDSSFSYCMMVFILRDQEDKNPEAEILISSFKVGLFDDEDLFELFQTLFEQYREISKYNEVAFVPVKELYQIVEDILRMRNGSKSIKEE